MFEKANVLLFSLPWPLAPLAIFLLMGIIGVIAYASHKLTVSGALAAVLLGFSVMWGLRIEGIVLFLVFFVLSNLAGKLRKHQISYGRKVETKEGARDWSQVFANGLMAAIASLWYLFSSNEVALVMFGASIAEAFSDTLAGEMGRISRSRPVSIITFRPVDSGMSGGVTAFGTMSGFAASAFIATLWALLFKNPHTQAGASFICLAGFAGCIIDSLLGALVQVLYKDKEGNWSEKPFDKDGNSNSYIHGIKWMDNDMVNFVSNTFACVFATGLYLIFE